MAQNLALPPASHQSAVQCHIQAAARQGEQSLVVEVVVPHILAVEVLGSLGWGVVLQDTVVVQVTVPTLVEEARNPAGGEVHILEEGNPVVVVHNLAVADLQRFNKNKLVSWSINCQFTMGNNRSRDFPFWSKSHKKILTSSILFFHISDVYNSASLLYFTGIGRLSSLHSSRGIWCTHISQQPNVNSTNSCKTTNRTYWTFITADWVINTWKIIENNIFYNFSFFT